MVVSLGCYQVDSRCCWAGPVVESGVAALNSAAVPRAARRGPQSGPGLSRVHTRHAAQLVPALHQHHVHHRPPGRGHRDQLQGGKITGGIFCFRTIGTSA